MIRQILQLDYTMPIVSISNGLPTSQFRLFLLQVEQRGLLIGTGSPSGSIEAKQGVEYMDETGSPGAVKYIKQVDDIAGDKTQGWVAIG